VKRTIDQAGQNQTLDSFDVQMLRTLFMLERIQHGPFTIGQVCTGRTDFTDFFKYFLHQLEMVRRKRKTPEAEALLRSVFEQKGDILKNQITFDRSGPTLNNTSSVLELDSDKRVLKRPAILEKSLALEEDISPRTIAQIGV
jgi:hypothetical protein